MIARRLLVTLAALALVPANATAFTQRGGPFPWGGTVFGNPLGTPPGHEPLTGLGWARARGMNADDPNVQRLVDVYSSDVPGSLEPRSAVYGVRWVDLMGYSIVFSSGMRNCFDYVAQSNHDVQYDHALRTDFDDGEEGRRRTMVATISRVRRSWLAAVASPQGTRIMVRDGGAQATAVMAEQAHFLLGVALHPLQDAYSPEHARRVGRDMNLAAIQDHGRNDRVIWVDAKHYGCLDHLWQHNHTTPTYGSGNRDVIWRTRDSDSSYVFGRTSYFEPSATTALAATEAVFRAYGMARAMSGGERERGAIFDREVARPYLSIALDEWWANPVGAGEADPAVCATDARQSTTDYRNSMECGREQCLVALERSNPGLVIRDLRTPPSYTPMMTSPNACVDPSTSYTH